MTRPRLAGFDPSPDTHGDGYTEFADPAAMERYSTSGLVAARFVDDHHHVTERYPLNPNGSPLGITALTTTNGRVTIMMPHPERVFRSACMSWAPADWPEDSPWMKLLRNARTWVRYSIRIQSRHFFSRLRLHT